MATGSPTTAGAVRRWAMRPALGTPALVVMASPVLTYVLLRYERRTLLALAAATLVLLTVRSPATAVLLLIPAGLLGAAYTDASFAVLEPVVVVTLVMAFQIVVGALPIRSSHLWVGLLASLLLISSVFPSVTSGSPTDRFPDLTWMLAGLGLLAVTIASPPHPQRLARVTAWAGALAAAYVLADGDYANGRLEGFGFNPNYLGILLALPLVAAVGLGHRTRNPAWLAPAAVCLVAIAETQSRGAFLAAAAGVSVVLVQGRPLRHQALILLSAVGIASALPSSLGVVENVAVGDRSSSELSYNSTVREHAAEFAARVAIEHPLRGIGFGMFPSYAAKSPRFGVHMATHNDYLRLAAEAGAAALAAFLALLWLGTKGRRSRDLAILRAVVVSYMVGLLFGNSLANLVASTPFWLSLGCLLAATPSRAGGHGDDASHISSTER
ncbi:MAG: hypothetical protein JWN52_7566 [Actinomycetia bacterium]|nr:hypothetical protein [Actinomycetes bacterium]